MTSEADTVVEVSETYRCCGRTYALQYDHSYYPAQRRCIPCCLLCGYVRAWCRANQNLSETIGCYLCHAGWWTVALLVICAIITAGLLYAPNQSKSYLDLYAEICKMIFTVCGIILCSYLIFVVAIWSIREVVHRTYDCCSVFIRDQVPRAVIELPASQRA